MKGMNFNIANVSWQRDCGVMSKNLDYDRTSFRFSFNVIISSSRKLKVELKRVLKLSGELKGI